MLTLTETGLVYIEKRVHLVCCEIGLGLMPSASVLHNMHGKVSK